VVALLAHGEGDGEAISLRRERAGGEGRVGTRRIFEVVEIEDELARFVYAVGRETGVEEAASAVGGGAAGSITKDEEKFCDGGIFDDGFEAERFSGKGEFRGAGDGLLVAGSHQGDEGNCFGGGIGDPFCGYAIGWVGRVPFEAVEAGDGGRMRILDAQGEAGFAADDIQVESADGQMGGDFVVVGFGAEGLRFRGSAGDEKICGESAGWGIQRDGFAFEMKDGEMRRATGSEMNLVVGSGADGVVAGLEPFEASEREPAVGLEEIGGVGGAPGGEVFLPGGVLRGDGDGKKRAENQGK